MGVVSTKVSALSLWLTARVSKSECKWTFIFSFMCCTLILHMYVVSTGDVIRELYFRKEDGNKHQLSNCLHIFSPVCVSQPHADACKYHESFAWPLPSHAKRWSVATVCFTVHYLWIWDDSTLSRHCEDNLPIQIRNRLFSNKTIVLHELSEGERWEEADWNRVA